VLTNEESNEAAESGIEGCTSHARRGRGSSLTLGKKGAPRISARDMHRFHPMKAKFTYWKESDGKYLGYLNSHPDHWTQGDDFEDLKVHLRDLHELFSAEEIPGIRKVAELEVA
jgi:predicted RNase H-like HicB family nuclease